jgi:hypothetical protein
VDVERPSASTTYSEEIGVTRPGSGMSIEKSGSLRRFPHFYTEEGLATRPAKFGSLAPALDEL